MMSTSTRHRHVPSAAVFAGAAMLICAGSLVAPASAAEPARKAPTRTLETITIKGEIEVPQVLFITSRDRLRFDDDAGRRYRPTAEDLLREVVGPRTLRVMTPLGRVHREPIPAR